MKCTYVCAGWDVPRIVQRMPAGAAGSWAWVPLSLIMCGCGTVGHESVCQLSAMGVLRLVRWLPPASNTRQHRMAMVPSDGQSERKALDLLSIPSGANSSAHGCLLSSGRGLGQLASGAVVQMSCTGCSARGARAAVVTPSHASVMGQVVLVTHGCSRHANILGISAVLCWRTWQGLPGLWCLCSVSSV